VLKAASKVCQKTEKKNVILYQFLSLGIIFTFVCTKNLHY